MLFSGGYYHPMDRLYHPEPVEGAGVKDIGMSVPLGIAAADVHGISAKIRSGAGNLEIGFPGAVRGQRQAQTPEMWGQDQRQALREMSNVNKVTITTHASYGIGGLAGQDQQGNFSDEYKKTAVDEIKRAIEFAADVAQGGSVVVHTGEYIRPISEEPWAESGKLFRQFEEEPERAVVRLVDKRTGHAIQQIRKNQLVARPVWNVADEDKSYVSEVDNPYLGIKKGETVTVKRGDYIDYNGNKVTIKERIPKFDKEKGEFLVTRQSWNDFVQEANQRNELEARKRGMTMEQYKSLHPDEYLTPEEAFLAATTESQERIAIGWAGNWGEQIKNEFLTVDMLKKAREEWQKIEANIPDDEKWQIMRREQPQLASNAARTIHDLLPVEKGRTPLELIEKAIKETEESIMHRREMMTGQLQQAEEARIMRDSAVSSKKYALKRSFNSYAEAGMHAFYETQSKHTQKPVMLTMENIFPEQYGGHPEELKTLITGARAEMQRMLKQKMGLSDEEAKKAAADHIKATIDTGHLNMWRKYWQGKDEDFNKWFLQQTESLAKENMIGNVHLTDNYGYQDDHLAPGQGNAPVKEFVKMIKSYGYKGALTVEPGADASTDQGDFYGLAKTWRYFGSPIYGLSAPMRTGMPSRNWMDVQYSYFGRSYPPYFVFGAYSPSNDWQPWSGLDMEGRTG